MMRWFTFLIGMWTGLVLVPQAPAADAVDFNRQIRPILSAHCFKCHGPDDKTREAGLRLDSHAGATAKLESENVAIVPGQPAKSEFVRRILSTEEGEQMPPAAANKPLSADQKKLLQTWIEQGAKYAAHWAFIPPERPTLPKVKLTTWPQNEIDHFVLAKLEAAGLTPAPKADKYTLVRRAYLDLIGLPPTPAEADSFVNDNDPRAFEKLIDKLLESPHYGERWARRWLDLARYADTNGYEKDRPRSIWPYRDWVINALNDDMPFDQFTIEQLAGDMLPGATPAQKIATGFHRNTMLNEEGGIDPQEFRFYSTVDRANTTATVWLGLTLGCTQCHTHKFDPIPHRDYYSFLAFLNNADEPEFDVPQPDLVAKRAEIEKQIAELEADLPNRWPLPAKEEIVTPTVVSVRSAAGTKSEIGKDGTITFSGDAPDIDQYTILIDSEAREVTSLRIETLTDPTLPSQGPGRTPHGNFVITEVELRYSTFEPKDDPDQTNVVRFSSATADFAQDMFPPAEMFDGKANTGWAIHGPGNWNVNRSATLTFAEPVKLAGKTRWGVTIRQDYGKGHTIGKLRLSLGSRRTEMSDNPVDVVRRDARDAAFTTWQAREAAKVVKWELLEPVSASSGLPTLTIQPDKSIFASGDFSKRDVYDLKFKNTLPKVTAFKLEALPDPRLPKKGPGSVAYEGPQGDFWLSEVTLQADNQKLPLHEPSQSFASGKNSAAAAIDGDSQTGWSINGRQGQEHSAVFRLKEPLTGADSLHLQLLFEKYYAAGLGRFRVWATADDNAAASDLPAEIERLLHVAKSARSPLEEQSLLNHFLRVAPEMAAEQGKLQAIRKQLPVFPTTLVLKERPPTDPRATKLHHRGEYLQPKEQVEPQVLSLLRRDVEPQPRNRLEFARWLVDGKNPLTARVTVNRQWAALFGRGLVKTTDDFGYQGSAPTHPELLDWLATEFPQRSWSLKRLHKLIMLSATYQQSSRIAPEAHAADPENNLLSRFPRHRVEAELIRDVMLKSAGLLSSKLGGPSVFPPQPAGVTSEGTYGPLAWNVSQGEDRYRRALYTFTKRTAPYAMLLTFDAPSGEACVPRRETSNSPLQALTLLNDQVFLEAAQALGKRLATLDGDMTAKSREAFRRCLTRPPTEHELSLVAAFYAEQHKRLLAKELDAAKIAGAGDGDVNERAAWTLVARALLNLDEAITKN